ncbi:MAG: hypothetical protein V1824_00670, partial [archaeon]
MNIIFLESEFISYFTKVSGNNNANNYRPAGNFRPKEIKISNSLLVLLSSFYTPKQPVDLVVNQITTEIIS